MISVFQYYSSKISEWNNLVHNSSNGTFLHTRNYLDYHKERFHDFSLMAYMEGHLVAVLPAHLEGTQLNSHLGLTYGGVVLHEKLNFIYVIRVVEAFMQFANINGIETILIKQVPDIYSRLGHQNSLQHAYYLLGARLISRQNSSAIPFPMNLDSWNHGKLWGLKKAKQKALKIEEANLFYPFWENVLVPNLKNKFNSSPVHSAAEISLLSKDNPGHIRQFNIYSEDEIVGGITIFETPIVARTQYISATPKGKSFHALNLLIYHLATEVFSDKKFLDLGTSYEQDKTIKKSLLYWKESFGAESYIQDTFFIETGNYDKLRAV